MLLCTLLVEDKPEIRRILVETLEEIAPVKFIGLAGSEQHAKRWLRLYPEAWDLIILDLFLGKGNGFSVLQACRHRRPWQKVVVITTDPVMNFLQRCKALGADAVLDKSREIDKLVAFCQAHAQRLSVRH